MKKTIIIDGNERKKCYICRINGLTDFERLMRNIIATAILFFCLGVSAQHTPMLQEGKVWNYYYLLYKYSSYYSVYVSGDTLVDGMMCKKLYKQTNGQAPELCAMLYEDAGRVYRVPGSGKEPQLLYDFTLHKGDTIGKHTAYFDTDYVVSDVSYVMNCGREYKRIELENERNPKRHVVWIEGIGAGKSFLNNQLEEVEGDYSTFLSCVDNGETTFTDGGFYGHSGVLSSLLADGKTWEYSVGSDAAGYRKMRQLVDGDTLIGSHVWKKIYAVYEDEGIRRYEKAMREEGTKVYELKDEGQERLFMDVGASYWDCYYKEDGGVMLAQVYPSHSFVDYCGTIRLQLRLIQHEEGSQLMQAASTWTEAVGGDCGIHKSVCWKGDDEDACRLLSCKLNGKYIYKSSSESANYSGTVTDQDGNAVAGAHVCIYSWNDSTATADYEYTAETAQDGSYSVDVEEDGRTYRMSVTADGYAPYKVNTPFYVVENDMGKNALSGNIVLFDRLDFTAGRQATIILPEAPEPSWGRYYRLCRQEGRDIIFELEPEPKANVPYVIYPDHDFSISFAEYLQNELPEVGYVAFPDNDDVRLWGFLGSYQSTDVNPIVAGSLYFLDDTPDCETAANSRYQRVGAFRAYLQIPPSSEIMMDGLNYVFVGEPTDITEVATGQTDSQLYDLQGRRVQGMPQRGLYIREGKKVIK